MVGGMAIVPAGKRIRSGPVYWSGHWLTVLDDGTIWYCPTTRLWKSAVYWVLVKPGTQEP